MDVRVGLWRKLSANEWMVVLEKTLESPLPCKEIQQVHSRGNQSWIFFERNDAEAETPIPWPPDGKNWLIWKRPWYWERLRAGGEGDDRGWYGWMASPTQWTWVWANSRRWWKTGKPGVLQSIVSQRVGPYLPTEQQQQQEGRINHEFCKVSVTSRQNISWLRGMELLTTNKFK